MAGGSRGAVVLLSTKESYELVSKPCHLVSINVLKLNYYSKQRPTDYEQSGIGRALTGPPSTLRLITLTL